MSVVPVQAGGKTKYYGYWKGNDTLQALPLNVDLGQFRKVYPEEAKTDCSCKLLALSRLELQAQPERHSIVRENVPATIAVLDRPLDCDRDIVLTGTIQATCRDPRLVASSVGIYLEETRRRRDRHPTTRLRPDLPRRKPVVKGLSRRRPCPRNGLAGRAGRCAGGRPRRRRSGGR